MFGWKFWQPKFQDASKVAILDYQIVTSCIAIVKVVLFTLYLKGNDMKNSEFGKILNFIHVHCGTTMQNF